MATGADIDVSIIVVSYNTKAMTLACLSSIARETWSARCELIVVDNASTDGSADAIEAHSVRPLLIRSATNLGFAGANMLAARSARGRYLLLLNPDTVVLDHAIDKLLRFAAQTPWAGIWGGRTVFADGSLNPSSCWARMTLWNQVCRASGLTALFPRTAAFNGEAYGGWARDTVREVDIVSGCFLLVRTDLWQRLGGFDPAFFMYGEEADFCLRSRAVGARPLVTPTATIVHYGGASEATRVGKMTKLLAAKSMLVERHWPAWQAPFGRSLLALWPLSRALALSVAAAVTRSEARAEQAAVWRQIWQARKVWRGATTVVRNGGSVPA
jgi:GT2 family glycosyltransferase